MIDGITVAGRHCRAHDPLLTGSTRFGTPEQASEAGQLGGRPRVPRATEIARALVEQNIAAVLSPYWRVLGFDIVTTEDGLELRERRGGGAKLYGESREGVVKLSRYEDLGAMVRVAELLQDRVFGKPKQAVEHTAPDGPILSALIMDPHIAEDARDLLRRAAAAQPQPIAD